MKTEAVAGVQPALMKWARQSLGMSVEDVAARLKRPIDEVNAWEAGSSAPTYPQLEKLAYDIYKRPLAVFFLPFPPEEAAPEREFRSLPAADLQTLLPDTHLRIRRAHAYQLALKELFDNRNPVEELIWRHVILKLDAPVSAQAQAIRDALSISVDTQIGWKDEDSALKQWRQAIENAGVFVFKDSFKQKEISGFCLQDREFPLIYLNNSTTKTRQIFSLLHELAHLLLKKNGISKFDKSYLEQLPPSEKRIEQFCNAIAAEVLVPSADFEQQTQGWSHNLDKVEEHYFAGLAKRYGVSREAVLRRFLDQNRVSQHRYEQLAKQWSSQQKKGSGGDWFSTQGAYISKRFMQEVFSRHYRQQISMEQASDLLGIKPKNFAGLEQLVLKGAAA